MTAPLTALGSPTLRSAWSTEAQASFDALKLALSSAPVLRTFDPARRAVLTTDASNVAVAAILTQPDEDGRQPPQAVAYESRKLTAADRNYPAHVLELLAVVHALRAFRHYLLGGGAARPEGCWTDFDLRTDNQAITWLKTNKHLNKMYIRWLDEIVDFRFDVTHLPGSRNPTDPLSRRGFADCDGPAATTGDPDAESQQEPFSRLGRDAPAPAVLAAIRARWASTRSTAAAPFVSAQGGHAFPLTLEGAEITSLCTSMFIALAGSDLLLGTGTTPAPQPPSPSADLFLSPTFVQTLATEFAVHKFFGPIMRGAAMALGKLVDRHVSPVGIPASAPKGGTFLVRCSLLYRRAGRGRPPLHTRRRRPLCAGAPRLPRRTTWGPLQTSEDGVSGSPPRLLGRPGRRRRGTCTLLSDVPAHQGGPRQAARAPPPAPSAVPTRRDDRGGLDCRAPDNGGRI